MSLTYSTYLFRISEYLVCCQLTAVRRSIFKATWHTNLTASAKLLTLYDLSPYISLTIIVLCSGIVWSGISALVCASIISSLATRLITHNHFRFSDYQRETTGVVSIFLWRPCVRRVDGEILMTVWQYRGTCYSVWFNTDSFNVVNHSSFSCMGVCLLQDDWRVPYLDLTKNCLSYILSMFISH